MKAPCIPRLARVTGAQAQALSAIARHCSSRRFTPQFNAGADMMRAGVYGLSWQFGMRPARACDRMEQISRHVVLEWLDARFLLKLPLRFCEQWLAARLPDLRIDALPAPFLDAAWEAMLAEALRELGLVQLCPGIRMARDGAVPAGVSSLPHSGWPYAWNVSVQSPDAAHTLQLEVAVDDTGLARLADLLRRLPPPGQRDVDESLDGLPVGIQAKVGATFLETADVRTLRVGDVVWFDQCLAAATGEIYLATPDGQGMQARACEKGGARYVVTQPWNSFMNDLSQESLDEPDGGGLCPPGAPFGPEPEGEQGGASDASLDEGYDTSAGDRRDAGSADRHGAGAGDGGDDDFKDAYDGRFGDPDFGALPAGNGLDLDRIPVRLTFDLGEQMLPLGELRRLQPGEYFDLQRRLDAGPLHIRANGTLIGTAELVDIEGRAGARILSLTLDRGTCR